MRGTPFVAMGILAAMVNAQNRPEKAEILNILQDEKTSWNAGDAEGYSRHFSRNGTFTNILGMFFQGREVFYNKHKEIFDGVYHGTKLEQEVTSIRFIHPDVAIVETLGSLAGFSESGPPPGIRLDEKGQLSVRLLQVLAKTGGSWQIESYHNVDVKPLKR